MARMSIDDKFLRDGRVKLLGQRLGWSRRETMGALLDVFAVAYDQEDDIIPLAEIDAAADKQGFATLMIEVNLGEMQGSNMRIKGAGERIEYLAKKREAGAKGGRKSGESRRNRNEAKRSSASLDREAFGNPPDPVPDLPPDPVPDLEDQKLSPGRDPAVPVPQQQVPPPTPDDGGQPGSGQPGPHAKAPAGGGHDQNGSTRDAGNVVDPQTIPTPDRAGHPPSNGASTSPTIHDLRNIPDEPAEYDPDDARDRGRLAERIYRAVSDARIAVAVELGLPAQLPFPPIAPSTSAGSFRDLRDRVREEGTNAPVVCWRIVANLAAQAREDKSLEWLGEKAFREGSWRSAREWLPAAHRPRAGPKGSAARANYDPKIGRIEPLPASAFRGGIQKL